MKRLNPINTFESRSGVKPIFDMGDVITNGREVVMIRNITSWMNKGSTEAIFLGIDKKNNSIHWKKEYHSVIREYVLLRKADPKIQLFLSNGGVEFVDLFDNNYQVNYPYWFEKQYNKLYHGTI